MPPTTPPVFSPNILPPRQQSRLSVTFGLVTASGILLAVLSYLLLHMFLEEANQKKNDYFHRNIQERIRERTEHLTGQLVLFNTMVGYNAGFGEFKNHQAQRSPEEQAQGFQQVFWIARAADENARYQIERIPFVQAGADSAMVANLQKAFLEAIQKSNRGLSSPMGFVILDTPTLRRYDNAGEREGRHKVEYGYAALAVPSVRGDGGQGYLVGVLPMRNILAFDDLIHPDQGFFLSLDFKMNPGFLSIYPVAERGVGIFNGVEARKKYSRNIDVFGFSAALMAAPYKHSEQKIIETLPFMIPVICVLMTIFGAVYVRNNRNQASMLTRMNKMLALKNMEMNSQVIERERLNQVLRKTEQEKRAIMDSVSDIIFEIDQKGRFMFLNEAWHRITGFPVVQSKELNFFGMLPEAVANSCQETLEKIILRQEDAAPFLVDILVSGNNRRQVQVRYSMIRMDDNNNPRVVGTMTDMEEFHRTQTALQEAEEKYRAIWENAVTGIYQASEDGHLISANPALSRIFGYKSPKEMLDQVGTMNRQLYASPKDRQAMLHRLIDEGQVSAVELQAVRRDGSHFWITESARTVRDSAGHMMYLEGSIDDITERKEADLRLKSALTELEFANRAKTEFLANMSHELRTPLNAIIGFSEIIKDEVFGQLEQKQYLDYARDIHESGRNLLNIINTILDVSRIEAGERHLNETVINIPLLIRGVEDLVRRRIDENAQNLKIDLVPNLPTLWGEELAIKQILLNLLTNASKFTPAGGAITVSARVEDTGDLRLSVTDTGIGLDDEEVDRVMAPFGQASGGFARTSSGPGLGLTLVNALTRLHGGHFEIISQKGVGTTASVILPASRLK